jgi:intraflagellar transport protein 56
LALQVYVALCYYKLDYYDVSNEILAPYLSKYPTSIIAVNLKAANQFRLYEGKAAEAELKELMELLSASSQNVENDLIRHNLVVFRRGENALQVLPPLVDIILEARLNLVIYHLRQDNIEQAFNLMVEVNPVTPAEYILKGVVNAAMGQMDESKRQCIDDAQQFFQLIGASASECDTIPGRQCMASCFFLMKQFEDVLIYLNSIKSYSTGSDCPEEKVDIFNYNFGICQAAVGDYREGEEALLLVSDERIRNEYCYISWLARCYIMNNKAQQAWELQSTLDNNSGDTFSFFHLIANECYKSGAFYYSAKAFDMLDRLDPSTEYWEGKRGACCGVFQQVVAEKEDKEVLREIIQILRNTQQLSPQAELIVRIMIKWGNENGVVGLG